MVERSQDNSKMFGLSNRENLLHIEIRYKFGSHQHRIKKIMLNMIIDLKKKCPKTQPYDALQHLEEEEVKANE